MKLNRMFVIKNSLVFYFVEHPPLSGSYRSHVAWDVVDLLAMVFEGSRYEARI